MTILAESNRGSLVEKFSGAERTFTLTCGQIELFEDKHRGIFEVWDGFFGRGTKPTSKEVKDLIALGLVGGGMRAKLADELVTSQPVSEYMNMFQIAQAIVGVAFFPDAVDEEPSKKKPKQKPQKG